MAGQLALAFLAQSILGLFCLLFLLRFFLQACQATFRHSFSHTVMRMTDFAVLPLRRVIPALYRWDSASLILALVTEYLLQVLLRLIGDFPLFVAGSQVWWILLGISVVSLIKLSIDIFLYAVIIQAVLSWFNPIAANNPVLSALTQPIQRPLYKILPANNGVDFTPIVVVVVAQLLKILLITPLMNALKVAL
jgi:YggT family protein